MSQYGAPTNHGMEHRVKYGAWVAGGLLFVFGLFLQSRIERVSIDSSAAPQASRVEALANSPTLQPGWTDVLESLDPPADRGTVDALTRFIRAHPDRDPIQQALRALEKLGGAYGVKAIHLIGGERPEFAEEAAVRLSRVRGRDAAPALLDVIRDTKASDLFVAAALRSLGQTTLRDTLPEILTIASDETRSTKIRVAATHALGSIADPEALAVLTSLLRSSTLHVRRQAIRAIGRIRSPAAVNALQSFVASSTNDQERVLAREALDRLYGKPTLR